MNKKLDCLIPLSKGVSSKPTENKWASFILLEMSFWRERLLGFGLAFMAFWIYWWKLCPGVFPGDSALASVSVLRAWPGHEMVGHPLWHFASQFFSLLPFGDVPYRLNLFSALCGAGAVYFLFRLVAFLLYDAMSEEKWMQQIDDELRYELGEKEELDEREARGGRVNHTGHHLAMAGGAASALAFTFCTPFWLASTRLHFQTFDVCLLLAAGYMLARYLAMASVTHLVVAMVLMGIGLVESASFVLLLLFSFFWISIAAHRHGYISRAFMILIVLCLMVGFLLAGVAEVAWVTQGSFSVSALERTASLWFQGRTEAFRAMISHKGWLLMLVQGLLPLLIIYTGRYHFVYAHLLNPSTESAPEFKDHDPEERKTHMAGLTWGIALIVLLGCVTHALLNLPGSPWYFSKSSAHLPVMPLLGISITTGYLFSFGLLLGHWHLPRPQKNTDPAQPKAPYRLATLLSAGIVLAICSLLGVAALRNRHEIIGKEAGFLDVFCRKILEAAPEARCFVTEGPFDMHLRVQGRLLKREISVLNLRERSHAIASSPGHEGAIKQTTEAFLVEWLTAHPEATSQVALLTAPRLWVEAGLQPLPSTLVYLGTKLDTQIDLRSRVSEHRLFWEQNRTLFAGEAPRSLLLRHLQSEMRAHVSRIANDLGVLCLHQQAREEALEAFALAVEMEPNNLCAWINHYAPDPVKVHTIQEPAFNTLVKRMNALLERSPAFSTLADYETRYGALYLPAVEHLANCYNTAEALKKHGTFLVLMQRSRDYVLASIFSNAEPRVSQQPSLKDGVADEELSKIVEVITGGYSKAAEIQLRNLLRKRRASLVAWSLLAEVLMNQGNFDEVRDTIIPEMRFITSVKDSEWLAMTEGCLAMRQETPDYKLAHDQFIKVLHITPELEEAQNLLLQTTLSLGDQALLEEACQLVLKRSPRQPMANAALGTLRLGQGRLEEAEKALTLSLAVRPSSLTMNDLGETLRRLQRLQPAEAMTRRALLLNPEFSQAWDTLALILRDQDRLPEAAEAHRAALLHCKTDIRLYLNAAHFEQARGEFAAARTLLQQAAPLLPSSGAAYQKTYNDLLKRLGSNSF